MRTMLLVLLVLPIEGVAAGDGPTPEVQAWEKLYEQCKNLKGLRPKEAAEILELFALASFDTLRVMIERDDQDRSASVVQGAMEILRKSRDPRLRVLQAVDLYLRKLKRVMDRVSVLEKRIKEHPEDTEARVELIKLYIGELDDAKAARRLLTEEMDKPLKVCVETAANPGQPTYDDFLLDLAGWYKTTFGAKNPGALKRAEGFCHRYIERYEQDEVQVLLLRAEAQLKELAGLLARTLYERQVEVEVPANRPWTTACELRPGDVIDIAARGRWTVGPEVTPFGPDGPKRGRRGALQAQIARGIPFKVGKAYTLLVREGGGLLLGMDDDQHGNNLGSLTVAVKWWKLTASGACSSKVCILELLRSAGRRPTPARAESR